VAREIDGKAAEPSASQIDSIYEQNKGRFGGQSQADALMRIRMVLAQRARQERRAAYESELRQAGEGRVRLPSSHAGRGPGRGPLHGPGRRARDDRRVHGLTSVRSATGLSRWSTR